ncbi:hypothetical protein SBA4_3020022 [Candidatus Sulfopaludibacter sp. SbA4]|nr:hypothetical protein SBA4_3020022 [Candidatus Sulfopaludibacter sp. SbA4]
MLRRGEAGASGDHFRGFLDGTDRSHPGGLAARDGDQPEQIQRPQASGGINHVGGSAKLLREGRHAPADEAEWEYAARAGSTGSRYGEIGQIAWYNSNSGGKTHEVGQKQANAWGLHDMLGNVWEWVEDWYAEQYPPGAATDPRGPSSGTLRVLRGGSWGFNSRYTRASGRGGCVPVGRDGLTVGVRCAGN